MNSYDEELTSTTPCSGRPTSVYSLARFLNRTSSFWLSMILPLIFSFLLKNACTCQIALLTQVTHSFDAAHNKKLNETGKEVTQGLPEVKDEANKLTTVNMAPRAKGQFPTGTTAQQHTQHSPSLLPPTHILHANVLIMNPLPMVLRMCTNRVHQLAPRNRHYSM